jgi:anaerobic selenocysteine-containing dehydrogenase
MGCMRACADGAMRSALCLGGNLFGANPDAKWAKKAIESLDLITYLSTTLNTGHAWGRARETLILPVLARDEEPQPTTQESMFNFVRLSAGGPARHTGPKSEVEVITTLASRLFGERSVVDFQKLGRLCHVREMIAQIIPGFARLTDVERPHGEFQIAGRTFHTPTFNTPTGKARFATLDVQAPPGGENQLRLMTVRSEGQFNTVVYEEEDIYRGQERRDVILMARADMDRLGLQRDQRVTVRSEAGFLANILVREHDIRAGNALMYFPEANVLVPAQVDPQSRTPVFKSVLVSIETGVPDNGTDAGARRALPLLRA